ncbi:MAG: glycosyltransferase family 2 protein [Rikenellaceae bacterium]
MNEYIDILVSMYGVVGILVIVATLLFFVVQLCYYLGNYRVIVKYKDSARPAIREATPAVSVLVPLFTEDYPFLDDRLPLIMAQEGVDFEVVLIYVGNNNDFFDDLQRMHQVLPNVVVTKIQSNPRFPISIKTALNVGAKAANNDFLIITTADCYPLSDRWLALMASGFKRGDVVIGYTGIESEKGLSRYFMRASRVMDAANWLSRAIKGKPYRGHRTNIGWSKSLYFEANGFSHLNMNIGEDDLFVQHLLRRENSPQVSVVLSPRASLNQVCWGSIGWWCEQTRFFRSAFKFYPRSAKRFERWEPRSRVLFLLCALSAIAALPLEVKIGAASLIIIRIIVVSTTVKAVGKRLGESGMILRYGLYDIVSPFYMGAIDMWLKFRRDPKVWR